MYACHAIATGYHSSHNVSLDHCKSQSDLAPLLLATQPSDQRSYIPGLSSCHLCLPRYFDVCIPFRYHLRIRGRIVLCEVLFHNYGDRIRHFGIHIGPCRDKSSETRHPLRSFLSHSSLSLYIVRSDNCAHPGWSRKCSNTVPDIQMVFYSCSLLRLRSVRDALFPFLPHSSGIVQLGHWAGSRRQPWFTTPSDQIESASSF